MNRVIACFLIIAASLIGGEGSIAATVVPNEVKMPGTQRQF
jgi:hypothetical protein